MVDAKKCDACGLFYIPKSNDLQRYKVVDLGSSDKSGLRHLDFCPDCYKFVLAAIMNPDQLIFKNDRRQYFKDRHTVLNGIKEEIKEHDFIIPPHKDEVVHVSKLKDPERAAWIKNRTKELEEEGYSWGTAVVYAGSEWKNNKQPVHNLRKINHKLSKSDVKFDARNLNGDSNYTEESRKLTKQVQEETGHRMNFFWCRAVAFALIRKERGMPNAKDADKLVDYEEFKKRYAERTKEPEPIVFEKDDEPRVKELEMVYDALFENNYLGIPREKEPVKKKSHKRRNPKPSWANNETDEEYMQRIRDESKEKPVRSDEDD